MDRREWNRQNTKQHIQQVLLQQLEQGTYIHQLSTTQLCQACGIAKSTFYLYYPDKYAVLEEIVEKVNSDLWEINVSFADYTYSISDLVSGKPTPIARNMVAYLSRNRQALRILFSPTGVPDFMYKNRQKIDEKFIELYQALHLSPKHQTLITSQFFSGVVGLFRFYLFENTCYTDEEMAVIFGNMLRNSLSMADHIR